jgi:hypothetical protein
MSSEKKSKNGEVSRQHEGPNVRIGINIKRTYEAKKKRKAETRKRTACKRIGRKPKVKYKRCLAEIRREDVKSGNVNQLK